MSEIVIENLYKSLTQDGNSSRSSKNVNLSIESGDIYGIISMSVLARVQFHTMYNFPEVPTKDGPQLMESR